MHYRGLTAFKLPDAFAAGDLVACEMWVAVARRIAGTVRPIVARTLQQHMFLDYDRGQHRNPFMMPRGKTRELAQWLAPRGVVLNAVIIADGQLHNDGDPDDGIGFDQSDDEIVNRSGEMLDEVRDEPNVLMSLWNEPWFNGGNRDGSTGPDLSRVKHVVRTLGLHEKSRWPMPIETGWYPLDGTESAEYRRDLVLDWIGGHQPRKREWASVEAGKVNHYVYEHCGVPYADTEPNRFERVARPFDGLGLQDAIDAAAFAFGAGGLFHSRSLIDFEMPSDFEIDAGSAFFDAFDLIPPETAEWEYAHDGTGNCPLAPVNDPSVLGELSARVRRDGREAWSVAGGASTRWAPMPRDGWRIADRPLRTIARYER